MINKSKIKNLLSKFSKKQIFAFIFISFCLILVSSIATYNIFKPRHFSLNVDMDVNNNPAVLAAHTNNQKLEANSQEIDQLNFLLLGYGGAGHSGGYLTDVIQIVNVDFTTNKINLISIPRDLWVSLPNGKEAKINTAFTLGEDPNKPIESGGQVAKDMAAVVSGLPINYYIAVDFVGFQRLIGYTLDGIEVDVPDTLDDPWYPIRGEEQNPCGMTPEEIAEVTSKYSGFELEKQFECRYEHIHFDPGINKMEGHEALAFVRSRHGSSAGDFSRSQRQHALLKAIFKKLLSMDTLKNAPEFFKDVDDEISTDIDLEILENIVPLLTDIGNFKINSVTLSTENVFQTGKSGSGQFILLPKNGENEWDQTNNFILQSTSK